jgi:hypothetical protein
MNERIRELAHEAGLPTYNPEGIPTKLEKFAELIIADCLKMCKKIWINVNLDDTILIHTTAVGTPDYNRGRMDCHDSIKEHFGVE